MMTYAIFTTKDLAELAQDRILRERICSMKLPTICKRWDTPVQKSIGRWYVTLPSADYNIGLGEVAREQLEVRPLPTQEFRMSKLALRRFLREINLERVLDALLEASPTAMKDWRDAQELRTDDPLVIEFKQQALKLEEVTEADIKLAFEAACIDELPPIPYLIGK